MAKVTEIWVQAKTMAQDATSFLTLSDEFE